jgi:hypothetical protein
MRDNWTVYNRRGAGPKKKTPILFFPKEKALDIFPNIFKIMNCNEKAIQHFSYIVIDI